MPPRVLIAAEKLDFAEALKGQLEAAGYPVLAAVDTAQDAQRILEKRTTDLLITDVILREGNCLLPLRYISESGMSVRAVVLLSVYNEELVSLIQSFCCTYVVKSPIAAKQMLEQIKMCMQEAETVQLGCDRDSAVTRALLGLGMNPNLDGAIYLPCIMRRAGVHSADIPRMTKDIYPEVAREKHVPSGPDAVESSLRYAINTTWASGEKAENWERMARETSMPYKKPSNAEFVKMLTLWLQIHPHGGFL